MLAVLRQRCVVCEECDWECDWECDSQYSQCSRVWLESDWSQLAQPALPLLALTRRPALARLVMWECVREANTVRQLGQLTALQHTALHTLLSCSRLIIHHQVLYNLKDWQDICVHMSVWVCVCVCGSSASPPPSPAPLQPCPADWLLALPVVGGGKWWRMQISSAEQSKSVCWPTEIFRLSDQVVIREIRGELEPDIPCHNIVRPNWH